MEDGFAVIIREVMAKLGFLRAVGEATTLDDRMWTEIKSE